MFNLNFNFNENFIQNILQWTSKTVKDNYMRIIILLLLVAISFGITAYNNYKVIKMQQEIIARYERFFIDYNPKIDTIYFKTIQLTEENKDLKQENKFLNFFCGRK